MTDLQKPEFLVPLGPDDPCRYVIAVWHPGVPLSLTDESLWTLEECRRDVDQVEADMPGGRAVICELRPVVDSRGQR